MVKGISRRVVVVDSPDQRFFEQAIFIVRNDAAGEGVTSRELVEEARRVAGAEPRCVYRNGRGGHRTGLAAGGADIKKAVIKKTAQPEGCAVLLHTGQLLTAEYWVLPIWM